MQLGLTKSLSWQEAGLEALLEGYQQASGEATEELIRRLSPELFRFFLAQQATRSEAEDLLQNTWLRVHKARHTYRPGSPVLPWIFAIARHVRVDGYRKTRRIQQHENPTEVLPEPPSQSAGSESRDKLPTFELLIANLPESQREVLTMLKVNGLSLEEAALATSSTVGAAKQKASRAYTTLRTLLSASGTWASS